MIDTTNDEVEVYEDAEGFWRWRRKDGANHQVVSISGEGYESRAYCEEAAWAYNADLEGRTA